MYDDRFPETIRISKSSYCDMIERVMKTLERTKKEEEDGHMVFAPERYPTLEELRDHDVIHNLRQYLPYLVLYREVYETDEDEFYEARQYIDEVIENYVEIIDDSDIRPVSEITPEKWKTMTMEDKCNAFDGIFQYYGYNEFEAFLSDLGYQPYMAFRNMNPKKYRQREGTKKIEKELRKIWDTWFGLITPG